MKITVMSDEISSDLETSLELMRSWGLDAVELRRVGGRRFPDVDPYWAARTPQMLKEFGIRCVATSPGLFRTPKPTELGPVHFMRSGDEDRFAEYEQAKRSWDHHINYLLPMSVEGTARIGARVMTIWMIEARPIVDGTPVPAPEEWVQIYRHAAELAGKAGIELAIEAYEPMTQLREFVQKIDHPALGVSWTPANAYSMGDPTPIPDGYELIKPYIKHIHFKDVLPHPTSRFEWGLDGGILDWAQQIKLLKRDGYDGYISVEPHHRPKVESVMKTIERIKRHIAEA